jgi:hypothetical protein
VFAKSVTPVNVFLLNSFHISFLLFVFLNAKGAAPANSQVTDKLVLSVTLLNLRNCAALCQTWPFNTCFMLFHAPVMVFAFLEILHLGFTPACRGDMELAEQYLLTSVTIERLRLLFPYDLLIVLIMSDNAN